MVVFISLFGLHSLIERVRLGVSTGGRMNLSSFDWEKLMHELYKVVVFFVFFLFHIGFE